MIKINDSLMYKTKGTITEDNIKMSSSNAKKLCMATLTYNHPYNVCTSNNILDVYTATTDKREYILWLNIGNEEDTAVPLFTLRIDVDGSTIKNTWDYFIKGQYKYTVHSLDSIEERKKLTILLHLMTRSVQFSYYIHLIRDLYNKRKYKDDFDCLHIRLHNGERIVITEADIVEVFSLLYSLKHLYVFIEIKQIDTIHTRDRHEFWINPRYSLYNTKDDTKFIKDVEWDMVVTVYADKKVSGLNTKKIPSTITDHNIARKWVVEEYRADLEGYNNDYNVVLFINGEEVTDFTPMV